MSEYTSRPIVVLDVVGDDGVGKTTLIQQWRCSPFCKELLKVAQIDEREYSCKEFTPVKLDPRLVPGTFCHGFLLVCDRTKSQTLDSCVKSAKAIQTACNEIAVAVLAANKSDMGVDDEDIGFGDDVDELDDVVELVNFHECSAERGINVVMPFLELITHLLGHDWLCKSMVDACRSGNLPLVKILCTFLSEQVFPSGDYLVSAFLGHVEEQEKHLNKKGRFSSPGKAPDPLPTGQAQVARFLLTNSCPLYALSSCYHKDPVLFGHLLLESFPVRPGGVLRWTKLGLLNLVWSWVPNSGDKLLKVDLSRNNLESLPEELFQVRTMQELDVKYNCLQTLPPLLHWQCEQLRKLNLAHNCLTTSNVNLTPFRNRRREATSGRKTLPKLFEVNLSHNQLSTLPLWVCDLGGLGVLNVRANPINRLPKELGRCRELLTLHADVERIVYPRRALVRGSASALVRYLNRELHNAMPYHHIGLRLLGNSGVGKGRVLTRLINPRASLPEHDTSAFQEGMFEMKARLNNEEVKVTMHALNFVDEEIFRVTHQCFLIQRAVYLAVWNAESGRKGLCALRLWLHSVRVCTPKSPVILVGTFLNKPLPDNTDGLQALVKSLYPFSSSQNALDEKGLPTIVGSVYVAPNAPPGKKTGIEGLRSLLYVTACGMPNPESHSKEPLVQQQVPSLYLKLQDSVNKKVAKLRRKRQPGVMSIDEFRQLARSCSTDELDDDDILEACQFLHECGMLGHFQQRSHSGLDKLVFVDLQWLYEAMSLVITAPKHVHGLFLENGILHSSSLPAVFQGRGVDIPEKWQTAILDVLERFHVIVALDRHRLTYLIPALLPLEKAKHADDSTVRALSEAVNRHYLLAYVPPGFWSHLISQLFVFLAKDVSKETPSRKAEVRVDKFTKSICISLGRTDISSPTTTPASFSPDRRMSDNQTEDGNDRLFSIMKRSPSNLLSEYDKPVNSYSDDYLQSLRSQNSNCVCTSTSPLSSQSGSLPSRQLSSASSSSGATIASLLASFIKENSDEEISVEFSSWQCGVQLHLVLKRSNTDSPFGRAAAAGDNVSVELAFLQIEKLPDEQSGLQLAAWGRKRLRAWLLAQVVHLVDSVLYNWFPGLNKLPCKVQRIIPCPRCLLERSALTESGCFLPDQARFFTLEECVEAAEQSVPLQCKAHGELPVAELAPDIVLADLPEKLLLDGRSLHLDTLDITNSLGSGGFASVFRAKYEDKFVAVKLFKANDLSGTHPQQELRAEVNMLQRLQRHPGVIRLVGACLSPLSLVLELAPCGSLKDLLRDKYEFGIPTFIAHHLLYQVAAAMAYLHSQNVIHCDLKPHNILLWELEDSDWDGFFCAKLADYGVSHFALPAGGRHAQGTRIYMGPEMLEARGKGHATYTAKADVYSFGVVVFEVITGRHPYWRQLATMRDYEIAVRSGRSPKMAEALAENQAEHSRRRLQDSGSAASGYYHDQMPPSFDLWSTPTFSEAADSGVASPTTPFLSSVRQDFSKCPTSNHQPPPSFRRSHLLAKNVDSEQASNVQTSPASPRTYAGSLRLSPCQQGCFETLVLSCLQTDSEGRPSAAAAAAHLSLCSCSPSAVCRPHVEIVKGDGSVCLAASRLSVVSEHLRKRSFPLASCNMRYGSPASPLVNSLHIQPQQTKRKLGSPLASLPARKDTPSPRPHLSRCQRNVRTPTRPSNLLLGRQLSKNTALTSSATSSPIPFSPCSSFSPGLTTMAKRSTKFTQYVVSTCNGSCDIIVYDCANQACVTRRPSLSEGDRITIVECVEDELWIATTFDHVRVYKLPNLDEANVNGRENEWSFPTRIACLAAAQNKLAGQQSCGILLGLVDGRVVGVRETGKVAGRWLPKFEKISDECVRLVATSNTSAEACVCCGTGEIVLIDTETVKEQSRWTIDSSRRITAMEFTDCWLWLACEGSDKVTQYDAVDGTRQREICTRCLDVESLVVTLPVHFGPVVKMCATDFHLWVLLSTGLLLLIHSSTYQLLSARQAHHGAADLLLLDRHSVLTVGQLADDDSDTPGNPLILQWQAEDHSQLSVPFHERG